MKKLYLAFLILVSLPILAYLCLNIGYNVDASGIDTLVDENYLKDKSAVDSFLSGVDKMFDLYITRLPGSVENKPKWKIIWHMMKFDKQKAEKLLSEHFNKTIFSEDGDISWKMLSTQLKYELDYNKNNLVLKTQNEIKNKSIAVDIEEIMANMRNEMSADLSKITTKIAIDVVVSVVGSIIAEEITKVGVRLGVTAASTAVGGTAGSFGGPIGTGIGIVVGVGVGITADYFLEKSNNQKIVDSMKTALNDARVKVKERYKELYIDVKTLNESYKLDMKGLSYE